MRYIYDMKSGMLQVRENEISLRKWSGGAAHLRTLQETLGAIAGFSREWPKGFVQGVASSGEILIANSETKRKSFFY